MQLELDFSLATSHVTSIQIPKIVNCIEDKVFQRIKTPPAPSLNINKVVQSYKLVDRWWEVGHDTIASPSLGAPPL